MPDTITQILIILSSIAVFFAAIYLNSKEIFGFYYACRMETDEHDAEVLWWIHAASKMYLGDYWTKPICGCSICMSSLHSFLFWIPAYIILPFSWWLLYIHAIYICILAGKNYIITADNRLDL